MGARRIKSKGGKWVPGPSFLRKYFPRVREDLRATYTRDLHKWLLVAPIIGAATGLVITAIAVIILREMWPPVLGYYLRHPWVIVPGLTVGFAVTGLIMQFLTPDPNQHSTEEVVRAYHDHRGEIAMRPFIPKLVAAITTVGSGGSAALEGPSIYGGGALGSWIWIKLRRFNLEPRDRRIMMISGAAAGMAAVFRAPLTGLVFALEMPYKDDLAHEALLPSLIASVVSYVTLASFLGAAPLFDFASTASFSGRDLVWCSLLGLVIGLIAMVFTITFRRARGFMVKWAAPHWLKLTLGGLLTGVCGLAFLAMFKGTLVPLGPNYEAVGEILGGFHSTLELVVFAALKLCATLCSLASGGVSAMFVPLFLTGGALGTAFAQAVVRSPAVELYAAVGMASFIAAGYKAPLAAVVFVAEATGGHAFIIPSLVGAAVAYAVSGDASASGDQRVHEGVKVEELASIGVREVMQRRVISLEASSSLRQLADLVALHPHTVFPVFEAGELLGTISARSLGTVPPEQWAATKVRDLANPAVTKIAPDADIMEALHLMLSAHPPHLLFVASANGQIEGVVTRTDILEALKAVNGAAADAARGAESEPSPRTAAP
jgi:chloride channel protein, CIC family